MPYDLQRYAWRPYLSFMPRTFQLTESEHVCLYNTPQKEDIPFPLTLKYNKKGHANLIAKCSYSDESFRRNDLKNINLWKLYGLFTGANKMSYIDSFLDRSAGCQQFVHGLYQAIVENKHHWFVS